MATVFTSANMYGGTDGALQTDFPTSVNNVWAKPPKAAMVIEADFVPQASEITTDYASGTAAEVKMHDGSVVRFTKIPEGYDPSDRDAVVAYLRQHQAEGAIPTGLLYLDPDGIEMHAGNKTVAAPLTTLPYEELCPGTAALDALQKSYR